MGPYRSFLSPTIEEEQSLERRNSIRNKYFLIKLVDATKYCNTNNYCGTNRFYLVLSDNLQQGSDRDQNTTFNDRTARRLLARFRKTMIM